VNIAQQLEATREDILTRSGQYFDYLHPERYRLEIGDIAHALANTCRFAGQCRQFYSVAQHSVYVSRIVPEEHALAGLLHDCAEAFIGDVPRPLKRMLSQYQVIEKRVEAALFAKFGIPLPLPEAVKLADLQLLAAEQAALLPPHDDEWAVLRGIAPAPIEITPVGWYEARAAFMARYDELGGKHRYVRVTFEGQICTMEPREVEDFVRDTGPCALEDVWLSHAEWEAIPEFQGF
jgi:hypothetical protein